MTNRHVVLTLTGRAGDPLDGAVPAARRNLRRGPPIGLRMSVEDISARDAGELRADPRNTVMEANAVFSLVHPKRKTKLDPATLDASLQTFADTRMPIGIVAVGAHATPHTGRGVAVAVLDTGLDVNHPAFADKAIVGKNFTGQGAVTDITDHDGHGTHCAGIVCGAPVDGVRVGVAPGIDRLVVGRVLGPTGGSLEMFLKGMLWAVLEEGADIVSMSLGYDLPRNVARMVERGMPAAIAAQAAMQLQNDIIKGVSTLRAFLRSQSQNLVLVAATGNESERAKGFVLGAGLPAAELFAVGAVGPSSSKGDRWKVADFSNGRALVVAPGVDVISARAGGGWEAMSGTSMATPHAAGVAALWVESLRHSGQFALPDGVNTALRNSATRRALDDVDVDATGAGMVQAPPALERKELG